MLVFIRLASGLTLWLINCLFIHLADRMTHAKVLGCTKNRE